MLFRYVNGIIGKIVILESVFLVKDKNLRLKFAYL